MGGRYSYEGGRGYDTSAVHVGGKSKRFGFIRFVGFLIAVGVLYLFVSLL